MAALAEASKIAQQITVTSFAASFGREPNQIQSVCQRSKAYQTVVHETKLQTGSTQVAVGDGGRCRKI
eukprot:1601613-Pyramimonas_sp.AAC.1